MSLSAKLQNIANGFTIVASIAVIVTLILGYQQFHDTQSSNRDNLELQNEGLEQEKDSRAVELFVRYNELMNESVSESNKPWRDNMAIAIAESIFRYRKDDEGWVKAVEWMVGNHSAYFATGINCGTYDNDFIKLLTKVYRKDFCPVAK